VCEWEIPAQIELIPHQQLLTRNVLGEMLLSLFPFLLILLDLF